MVRDFRLLPIALLLWVSTAISLPWHAAAVAALATTLGVLGVLGLVWIVVNKRSTHSQTVVRTAGVSLLVAGVLLGSVTVHAQARASSGLPHAAQERMYAQVSGIVVMEPKVQASGFAQGALVLTVRVTHARVHNWETTYPGRVRVTIPREMAQGKPAPRYGAVISLAGGLSPSEPAERDLARLTASAPPAEVGAPGKVDTAVNAARTRLNELVQDFSPQARGLVPGAAIGDTSALPVPLADDMKISGLTHITAVSGSHFAIVFLVILGLTWRLPRTLRAVLVAAVALGFVALVHPSPAVLRAAAMGGVAILGLVRSRPSQSLAALCAVVVGLLVYDPWHARDYGFVLSVLATGGLVLGAGPIADFLHRPSRGEPFLPKVAARALAVPIAAQLAVGPVLLTLQPYVSVYSVAANIAAAPALFPATVFGLAATVLAGVWPLGALVCAHIASGATWWIAHVAQVSAGAPGSTLAWSDGPGGVMALAAVTVLVVGLCWRYHVSGGLAGLRKLVRDRVGLRVRDIIFRGARARVADTESGRSHADGWSEPRILAIRGSQAAGAVRANIRLLHRARLILALCVLVVAVLALSPTWLEPLRPGSTYGRDWSVASCDVGQGDAFVLRTAGSGTYLIDTGPPGAEIGRCLTALDIAHVDAVFLTHFHADHIGGLDQVLRTVRVGRIVAGPDIDGSFAAEAVRQSATHAGVPLSVFGEGELPLFPGVEVEWPTNEEVRYLKGRSDGGEDVTNDASLVVVAQLMGGADDPGPSVGVFLGDLEETGQSRLARHLNAGGSEGAAGFGTGVDLVKVAHHGSASMSSDLVKALDPKVALIGVGTDNTYGHPTARALDSYRGVGAAIIRTDLCGTTAVGKSAGGWFVVGDCP